MMYLFPELLIELLVKFPNLTCSLLENSKLRLFSCGILNGIIALKIFAQINPTGYLKMNHEKIRKMILGINLALFVAITVATTNMFGSLCPRIAIDYFEYLTSSELDKQEFNFIPFPLQFLYGICILILTVAYYLIKRRKTTGSWNMLEKLENCRTSSNQVANFLFDIQQFKLLFMIQPSFLLTYFIMTYYNKVSNFSFHQYLLKTLKILPRLSCMLMGLVIVQTQWVVNSKMCTYKILFNFISFKHIFFPNVFKITT